MLTKKQVRRLRGLIARHARCEWNMGASMPRDEAGEKNRRIIVAEAKAARAAVFAELLELTEQEDDD